MLKLYPTIIPGFVRKLYLIKLDEDNFLFSLWTLVSHKN